MNLADPAYRHILSLPLEAPLDNHYQLLGVPLGESDRTVLEAAMLEQVIKVRRYQSGAYQSQAAALLNELGQAYVCLTDDELRREYDRTLRRKDPAAVAARVPKAEPPAAAPAASEADICPECGKPMSPRTAICMHCNYHRRRAASGKSPQTQHPAASGTLNAGELLKQDLTPEQLLARLQLMRDLHEAQKLSLSHWTATTTNACHLCGHHLTSSSDAYTIRFSTLGHLLSYLESYARRQQSQGRMHFTWPLSTEAIGQLQTVMGGHNPQSARQFCRNCAERLLRSARV